MPMGSNFGAPVKYDHNLERKRQLEEGNRKRFEQEQREKKIRDLMPPMPGGPTTPLPTPVPSPVPGPVPTPDTSGTDAAMARAKDRAGLVARGALTGVREALGERGVLGGGVEGRATAGVAEAGQQQIADASREASIKEADTAQRMAEMVYQGGITQRGQDISARGQDISAQNARVGMMQNQYDMMLKALLDAMRDQIY